MSKEIMQAAEKEIKESLALVFSGVDKASVFSSEEPKKKVFICPTHGGFNSESMEFGERWMIKASCSKCLGEHHRRESGIMARAQSHAKTQRLSEQMLKSGVSKRNLGKTFESFNADTQQKQAALNSCKFIAKSVSLGDKTPNLIMSGSVGTGKTHLASAIVAECVNKGKRVRLVRIIELLRALKGSWSKDAKQSEAEILEAVTNYDLLLLDEVGVQFESDTEKMFIFDIINGRYDNELPTVLISNMDLNGVTRVMGERVIDRLKEDGGSIVAMDWESYRSSKQ